jgi:hypothetical protein
MRTLTRITVALALAGLAACGGGGGGGSTTAPTAPTGPTQASITVTQTGQAQVCVSPLASFNLRLAIPIRITESAGMGANFNFIRLQLLRGGVEIERQEVGSTSIIAGLGSNRLAASGNVSAPLRMDFNSSNFDNFNLLFNFTDDRGNVLQANLNNITNVVAVANCTI